jgi:D-sedoheptulose 7-phosphate isomerase
MDHVQTLLNAADGPGAFAAAYLGYLATLAKQVDPAAVAAVMERLDAARREQRTVFIIGNGGSAATASHMATDLSFGTRRAQGARRPRAVSLTDNQALMTAAANDEGYAGVFVAQLEPLYRPGDLLVAISASGNSPNVLKAVQWVKARGGQVIGFIGFDGGALRRDCDLAVHVKTQAGEYGPVEDVHLMLNHLIAAWLRHRMEQERRPLSGAAAS